MPSVRGRWHPYDCVEDPEGTRDKRATLHATAEESLMCALRGRGARGRTKARRVAKPWWQKRGWSTQGGILSGVFRAAQRPTGAPGGLAAAWSPVEMVRLQPAPEARAAPPYPRPAASGELPRMGKRRTVGRVSTGQFARSLRRSRVHAE